MTVSVAAYGSWPSPITADALVAGAAAIDEVRVDGADIWWAESRPDQGGRVAVLRWREGATTEITPPEANVRTLVHEYGGGSWTVADRCLYWVDFGDQILRRTDEGGATALLTPAPEVPRGDRYADLAVTPDGRWVLCVRERHGSGSEPANELVAVAADGSGTVAVLASGADFYSSPRPSPTGDRLAWIQWNHPDMPWDDTQLWVAPFADGVVGPAEHVAGFGDEAVVQPEWDPAGVLHHLSDRSDRWWLYRVGDDTPVAAPPGDIGMPPWVFGMSRYAFTDRGEVVAVHREGGIDRLAGAAEYTSIGSVCVRGDEPVFVGASWSAESAVVAGDRVIRAPRDLGLDDAYLASPELLSFATTGGATAHALYYAPANPGYEAPPGERPPLMVLAHGGPTSEARRELNLGVRFWTSRGIGVVDVDYRGSSGYGRAYRRALDGGWGVLDVDDCIAAADHLVERGDIDGSRILIRGGSAGGYTVLCALAFHDRFAAGGCRYGIADLEALAADTHKFESRYLDRLVGPYPAARDTYRDRSPIHHVDRFATPMIVLQGSEDAIVPPAQSRMIVDALSAKGVPVAYLEFEGEQHGFRVADNIVRALEAELWFYGRVLGFDVADAIEPVEIVGDVGPPSDRR